LLPGIRVHDLITNIDERGSFTELLRLDWADFFQNDVIRQINRSISDPGVIRAWHRHLKGQIDYICCVKGSIKVCAYDGIDGSRTKGQIDEILIEGEHPKIIRMPGYYWHGTKCIGDKPSIVMYFITNLYDYKNPDEERKPWDDPEIIDLRTGRKYVW